MFTFSHWLNLSMTTRMKVAEAFGIPKTGRTHVFNNTIQNDGFEIKDIEEKITRESLQSFLETDEENLGHLWRRMVDKVEMGIVTTPGLTVAPTTLTVSVPKKPRGRPRKTQELPPVITNLK